MWKAERKLERKLGRPLTVVEAAFLAGDTAGWRREVRAQLAKRRADAADALVRLRAELKAET